MMQAMVDHVTGMVYWVPITDPSAAAPMPPVAPLVMQPSYRLLRPVIAPQVPAMPAVGVPVEMNTTVFVRGIPREATTQSVEGYFKIYGEIVSCHVIRHKDASTNKGIAFVKFRDAAAAQRAINCNHPGVMEQREVFAEWAHPRPASSAARAPPDQQVLAGPSSAPAHVYLPAAASGHVISPRFLPFGGGAAATAHSWMVGGSYGSPYLPGSHVLGFPTHAGFSGHENYGFSNYFPATEYHSQGSYAPVVPNARAGSSARNESDTAAADESDREGREREGREDDGQSSISQLHLGDSDRSTKSRKGKEKET